MQRIKQLKQLWQRLAARERILAGVVLTLFLLNALYYGTVRPYRTYTARLEEDIGQQTEHIAKMVRVLDRAPQVEQQVAQLRQRMQATQGRFIHEDTSALAASRLQERLQKIASASGLDVLSTVSLRDRSEERRVGKECRL